MGFQPKPVLIASHFNAAPKPKPTKTLPHAVGIKAAISRIRAAMARDKAKIRNQLVFNTKKMDRNKLKNIVARRFAKVFGFHRDKSYSFELSDHPQGETCWVLAEEAIAALEEAGAIKAQKVEDQEPFDLRQHEKKVLAEVKSWESHEEQSEIGEALFWTQPVEGG